MRRNPARPFGPGYYRLLPPSTMTCGNAPARRRGGPREFPGASLGEQISDLAQAEAIEHALFRHPALAGHLDAPMGEIELGHGMRIRVDAHPAAELERFAVPAPVEVEPPGIGIDLDRDAVL